MKLVVCILFLAVGVFTEKEIIDDNTEDATNFLAKRLWTQIRKRLKDYGYSETDLDHLDRELDDEQCTYNFQNGTIIRTHDSIEAGATFINSQIGISREDCTTECCSVANCNIAVFKEKVKHNLHVIVCKILVKWLSYIPGLMRRLGVPVWFGVYELRLIQTIGKSMPGMVTLSNLNHPPPKKKQQQQTTTPKQPN